MIHYEVIGFNQQCIGSYFQYNFSTGRVFCFMMRDLIVVKSGRVSFEIINLLVTNVLLLCMYITSV